jgi:hypothetical protein
MTGLVRRALCAAAPFALLPAVAAHAAPSKDISNDLGADDFALPDAPLLTSAVEACRNASIQRPIVLRGVDVADNETVFETSLTGAADAKVQKAVANKCASGIVSAALTRPVSARIRLHRT